MNQIDFSNWAVVSYNDDTGLGRQAKDMVEYLQLGHFLVFPSERLKTQALVPDRDIQIKKDYSSQQVAEALNNIQGIIILEKPNWHQDLLKICKKLGIISIAIPNWEWFDGKNPLWKLCDLFLCTSKFTEKVVKSFHFNNTQYIGTHPVGLEFLPKRQITGKAKIFFHNAGLMDEDDRKGTMDTVLAFNKVKNKDISLIVRSQRSLPFLIEDNRIDFRIGNLESVSDLYNEGDVAIQPSKMEGNGFSIIEAKASGVPVITTDYYPMNEIVTEKHLLVKKKWFKRKCFPRNWIKQAHLRLPVIKDLSKKIIWCAENDLTSISKSNFEWGKSNFNRENIKAVWSKAIISGL